MTRQEAIEDLKALRFNHNVMINGTNHTSKALDIAIEALELMKTKQQAIKALDTISRQSAIDALAKFVPYAICDESTESYTNGLKDAYNLICQLPSAESETIRCKDCKWFERHEEGLEYFGRIYDGECNLYCQEESQPFDEDGFCSNAERRTE